jgi:hypothetical protein
VDARGSERAPPEVRNASAAAAPASPPADIHPYRRAWETRDLDAWEKALSPSVVMHSPVLSEPFVGRDVALDLFRVLFECFEDFRFTDELGAADVRAFFWRAGFRGQTIEGADLVRLDAEGNVSEITVLIRPLVNIAVFATAIGGPLAARRGALRGVLVRLLNSPLGFIFRMVDRVASRLVGPK